MRPRRSSSFSSGSSTSKRSRKNSPSRPSTVTALPSASTMRPPGLGFLLTPSCARASCVPVTRSIRISTAPPLSLCPNKRAGSTRVSLNTSKSPGRSSRASSVNRRSAKRCVAASTTSRRLAERSGNGACAINSGGRSKWKSDFFKAGIREWLGAGMGNRESGMVRAKSVSRTVRSAAPGFDRRCCGSRFRFPSCYDHPFCRASRYASMRLPTPSLPAAPSPGCRSPRASGARTDCAPIRVVRCAPVWPLAAMRCHSTRRVKIGNSPAAAADSSIAAPSGGATAPAFLGATLLWPPARPQKQASCTARDAGHAHNPMSKCRTGYPRAERCGKLTT